VELNSALQALTDLKLEQQILAHFLSVCGVSDSLVRVMQISPKWFGVPGNALLFRALRAHLRQYPGCSIHSSAMKRRIDRKWGLDSTDGAEAVVTYAEVRAMQDVPKLSEIGPMVGELEELYTKRLMAETLLDELGNIQHSSAGKVASHVLGVAAATGKSAAHTITADMAVVRCERYINKLVASGNLPGISTGIPQLDAQMLGLFPGRLYAVAARTGGGKSRFILNLAWNQAVRMSIPVIYFSLEMPADDLGRLVVSRTLAIDYMRLMRGIISDDERRELKSLRRKWLSDPPPLCVVDLPRNPTILELHREMDNYRVLHGGVDPRCVYVDYAGKLKPESGKRNLQKYEQLDDVFDSLASFARKWRVPVVTPLQLNRDAVKADKIGLEHISLSDMPSHHCDTVWALSQREADVEQTAVDMTFLKQRYGSKKPLVLWANWPMSYLGEVPAVQQQKLNEQAQADAQNVAHAKDL
jgi:replicative DNA helicase